MCVVIIGGNDRMVCQYREICKQYRCKAKIFTKMPAEFKRQIGQPDLLVLFTNTVSHKMVCAAVQEASKSNTVIARCHRSSSCALKEILNTYCCGSCASCGQKTCAT